MSGAGLRFHDGLEFRFRTPEGLASRGTVQVRVYLSGWCLFRSGHSRRHLETIGTDLFVFLERRLLAGERLLPRLVLLPSL
jgi:hypothetical protein